MKNMVKRSNGSAPRLQSHLLAHLLALTHEPCHLLQRLLRGLLPLSASRKELREGEPLLKRPLRLLLTSLTPLFGPKYDLLLQKQVLDSF